MVIIYTKTFFVTDQFLRQIAEASSHQSSRASVSSGGRAATYL